MTVGYQSVEIYQYLSFQSFIWNNMCFPDCCVSFAFRCMYLNYTNSASRVHVRYVLEMVLTYTFRPMQDTQYIDNVWKLNLEVMNFGIMKSGLCLYIFQ